MTEVELLGSQAGDPLPPVGTRVFVTGTRHHGFRGTVVERPKDWPSPRSIAVELDEWFGELFKFYVHNLITL